MFQSLKSGFGFIARKLLGRDTGHKYDAVQSFRTHPRGYVDSELSTAFRSDATSMKPREHHLDLDCEHCWAESPDAYIGKENIDAVIDLLSQWITDMENGSVLRPQKETAVPSEEENGPHINFQLSAVIYNLMLLRHACNQQGAWEEICVDLLSDLRLTRDKVQKLYSHHWFEEVKASVARSKGTLGISPSRPSGERSGFRAASNMLLFLVGQSEQLDTFRGRGFPKEAMTKMATDFEAYHNNAPILSYIHTTRKKDPSGYMYGNETLEILEVGSLGILQRYHPTRADPSSSATDRDLTTRRRLGQRLRYASPGEYYASKSYRRGELGTRTEPGDGADWMIFPDTSRQQTANAKRKGRDGIVTADQKRRRLFAPELDVHRDNLLSPEAPAPGGGDEGVIAPRAEMQKHRLAIALPEDEPDQPQLKISTTKRKELQLAHQRRLADEAAVRAKKAEEQQRREEERRKREEEEEQRARRIRLRAPSKPAIATLSEAWQRRVMGTLEAQQNVALATSPEGSALKRKDFETVVPKTEWLNDEIVNGSLIHLANYINKRAGIENSKTQTPKCHAFTSFFWDPLMKRGAAGTQRWMKRNGVTEANFLDIDTLLIPICQSNHWTLVVVRPPQRTIAHMDSLGSGGAGRTSVTDIVFKWVKEVLREKWSADWKVVNYQSPRQTNGWDCGVHAVTNALFLALGLDPAFYTSVEMPLQRDRIAAILLNGGFSGDFDLDGL